MKRGNIDRENALRIIGSQLPIEEKVGYADYVIDNGGDPDQTRKKADELWLEMQRCQVERAAAV